MLYKSIKNSSGQTLADMVVGLVLISIMATTGAAVHNMLTSASKAADEAQTLLGIGSQIRERLKYENTCESAIAGGSGLNQASINTVDLLNGNQPVQIQILNLDADVTTLEEGTQLLGGRMTVNYLRFVNAVLVDAPTNEYIAQIRLGVTSKSGLPLKPMLLGSVNFRLTGVGGGVSIADCEGIDSAVNEDLCQEDLGCEWMPNDTCRCAITKSLCAEGEYPIVFNGSDATCVSLGDNLPCPSGEYIKSIGLGNKTCAPLPTVAGVTPTPAPIGVTPTPSPTGVTPTLAPGGCNTYYFQIGSLTHQACLTQTGGVNFANGSNGACPANTYYEAAPGASCNGYPVMKCIPCGPGPGCTANPSCAPVPTLASGGMTCGDLSAWNSQCASQSFGTVVDTHSDSCCCAATSSGYTDMQIRCDGSGNAYAHCPTSTPIGSPICNIPATFPP